MNGIIYWNKKWLTLYSCFWNDATGGGNLYYRIPYLLTDWTVLNEESMKKMEKVIVRLFRKNPDFSHCEIELCSYQNKATTQDYVTAIVVTNNREFYKKYTDMFIKIQNML